MQDLIVKDWKKSHSVYPSLIRLCKYLRRRWTEELFQELICLIVLYFGLQMHLSSFAQLFTSSVAYMSCVANMAPRLGIVLLSEMPLLEKSAMRYLYWLLDMHFTPRLASLFLCECFLTSPRSLVLDVALIPAASSSHGTAVQWWSALLACSWHMTCSPCPSPLQTHLCQALNGLCSSVLIYHSSADRAWEKSLLSCLQSH